MSMQHQECVGFFKEWWVKHRENHCLPLPLLPKEELTVMVISQEHPSLHAELKLFCQWTRMYTHSISNQHILHQWKHSGGWLGNLVHQTQQLSTGWWLQLLSRGQVWQWQRSELLSKENPGDSGFKSFLFRFMIATQYLGWVGLNCWENLRC